MASTQIVPRAQDGDQASIAPRSGSGAAPRFVVASLGH